MGLATSQVRLLALTTRKADIELQMQVNSKRKQMLTRKSTELAQQYYSRLQDANVQYATSNGYEDVDYNYLMGQSKDGMVGGDFLQQVATMSDQGIAQKSENRMILTDQYGQVILNNELALVAESAKRQYSQLSVTTQSAHAIWELLQQNQDVTAIASVFQQLQRMGEDKAIAAMELMLKNGGYKSGGTVYTQDEVTFYSSAQAAGGTASTSEKDIVKLQKGYCYEVLNPSGVIVNNISGHMYDGSKFVDLTTQYAKYLGNIISYFGPMISAAIQNGSSVPEKDIDKQINSGYSVNGDTWTYDKNGIKKTGKLGDGEAVYKYTIKDGGNKRYTQALNTEKLQAGFKSGTYQLCMVTDAAKGLYHKNTTLEYFTHMNYVVQKTDSSKREEITAWFNAEQADISEQETYWDTEITNLSTELNSVNTEIDSVKQLKSNAIKSVFDWGSS